MKYLIPPVVIPVLLVMGIAAYAMLRPPIVAGHSPSNAQPQPSPEPISATTITDLQKKVDVLTTSFDTRLKQIEESLRNLPNPMELNSLNSTLTDLRALRSNIADATLANSNAKLDLANYISTYTLTLFGIFIGILAALATLGGFLIKYLIQESVLNSARKRENDIIGLQIQFPKILTVDYLTG